MKISFPDCWRQNHAHVELVVPSQHRIQPLSHERRVSVILAPSTGRLIRRTAQLRREKSALRTCQTHLQMFLEPCPVRARRRVRNSVTWCSSAQLGVQLLNKPNQTKFKSIKTDYGVVGRGVKDDRDFSVFSEFLNPGDGRLTRFGRLGVE